MWSSCLPTEVEAAVVRPTLTALLVLLLLPLPAAAADDDADLRPAQWRQDYDRYLEAQSEYRRDAGVATGENGAVSVAYNALAARAGLEALKQGGNAMDALLTSALAQVALTAGAPISYFGIMSLVYYDASTDTVYTLNAEWNTVLAETNPMSIPGGVDLSDPERGMLGRDPSGRTALVGGFMKGVGAAHERFGELPFEQLFQPAIAVAEEGFAISERMASYWTLRAEDLARLPETRATLLNDGSAYAAGDTFRQPALAETLRAVSTEGVDYMYTGPWAERLVAAVQADGGRMTLEDLAAYEVIWGEPLQADLGNGYRVYTNPPPNNGGASLILAQHLATASGLTADGHWSESGTALKKALDITQLYALDFLPDAMVGQMYPGVDLSTGGMLDPANAAKLWPLVEGGRIPTPFSPRPPQHSDDVVAIDRHGNIAAMTQSINCVLWGKTAIVTGGITIGDPASFQQMQIARAGPGNRLESPTETGILFRDGKAVLGFASMGSGLHQRTFQALQNVIHFGMTVDEAIDAPDFFMPSFTPNGVKVAVPKGRFPTHVLDETGYDTIEFDTEGARFGGEGVWIAISRDPETGELRAASHNRSNSAAVAF